MEYKTYKKWLNSSDKELKPKLIDALNKAGIPLEYRTKKRLETLDFEANPYHYEIVNWSSFDPANPMANESRITRRELDFLATSRRIWRMDIKGVDVRLRLKLAVECKYSSYKDFFCFEFQDPLTDLPNFPVKLNGWKILPQRLDKYFNLPIKIEKITEVDVSKMGTREKENFHDRTTQIAAEQLASAVSYTLSTRHSELYHTYFDTVNEMDIKKKFEELDRRGKVIRVQEGGSGYIPDEFQDDFCKKNITHFDFEKIGLYIIDVIFPLIVTDETRGVIKAVLDNANEIVDFEDVGFGVYKFVSPKTLESGYVGEPTLAQELPILICNLSYLDKCISKLVGGMEKLKRDVELSLNENPHHLVKDIMFKGD